MTTITMRKPGFMRNDAKMRTYLTVINTLTKELSDPRITHEELYDLTVRIQDCYEEAAKAGGFVGTQGFLKWLDSQSKT